MTTIRQRLLEIRQKKSLMLLVLCAFISLIVIIFAIYLKITDIDMTTEGFITLLIGGVLIFTIPYGLVSYQKYYFIKGKENQIPNLLRHLSEASKTGMSLPQALSNAARGDYGPLTEDVQVMSNQLSWGVPFPRVIELFMERNKESPFTQQSMSIIIEAYRSGGDIGETMDSVAKDAQLVKELEQEQKAKMAAQVAIMYVIHMIFLVIILSLTKILKPLLMIQKSSGLASFFGSSGSKTLTVSSFRTLFFQMSVIEGIYNGLIAGQIGEGSIMAGMKHTAIMLGASLFLFIFIIKTEPLSMSQLSIGSFYYPDQEIPIEGVVTYSDGSQVDTADVGVLVYYKNVPRRSKGDVACEVDLVCQMCFCGKTDSYGKYKVVAKAPIEAGEYTLKFVVHDRRKTKERVSESTSLTVG